MPPFESLPYRPCAGLTVINPDGLVFVGRRTDGPEHTDDTHVWQMPQGGIDEGENPRQAVLRELAEEIGTANADIVGEHPEWLSYDLPPHLVGIAFKGRYRGQSQRWFALKFRGQDSDIKLDAHTPAEFAAWRWANLTELPDLAVDFKRPIYATLARDFARFAA